jgi:hypothetical protein
MGKAMTYVWVIFAIAIAFIQGRSMFGWAFAAWLVGPFALIPPMFMKAKSSVVEERTEYVRPFVENYLVRKEFKGVNTVDDLFKKLEPKGTSNGLPNL